MTGAISRNPPLTIEEWLEHIEGDELLVTPAPRTVDNPFKPGEKHTFKPRPGYVSIESSGSVIGAISPSDEFETDQELIVWASAATTTQCKAIVQRIAASLGATVLWFDDETGS